MSGNSQEYKYVIDQMSAIEIGAGCTYRELIENPDLSHKFRQICRNVFEEEVDPDTSLESHLYYLEKGTRSYEIFKKLKTKVIAMVPDTKRGKKEDGTWYYHQETYGVDDLAGVTAQTKMRMGVIIQEIIVSKVGIATVVV